MACYNAGTDDPIAAIWLISFEKLRRAHPTATDYLCFMSCIDPRGVIWSF